MLSFAVRRVSSTLITIWLAVTLAFVLLRLIPGDAVAARLALTGASESQIAARRTLLGLDSPPMTQYFALIGGLLQGDLGYSLVSGRRVSEMIFEPFSATLTLALGALGVALVMGIGMGITASLGRSWLARAGAWIIALVSVSSPVYWTGTLAILLFSVGLRWLPSTGTGAGLRPLILPWFVLGFAASGGIARLTAAVLIEMRSADFTRTARAKGLHERRVIYTHLLRAGAGAVITFVMIQVGFLLSGAVVTEMIFVRPGVGTVLLSAINDHDFPVVQGVVILSAVLYSFSSAAADLLTAVVDPRLRTPSL